MKDFTERISCSTEGSEPIAVRLAPLLGLLSVPGELRLTYRISVHRAPANGMDKDSILVKYDGPETRLVLDGDGEVLRAAENMAAELLARENKQHKTISIRVNVS